MKYRKIPVIIEAVQFTAENVKEMYEFINGEKSVDNTSCNMAFDYWCDYAHGLIKNGYDFKTLESNGETQKAVLGDYIIKGIKGEFYPCKPDIFELTYELV
jgi:hypothetical protein